MPDPHGVEYPFEHALDLEAFEYAAKSFGLSRQQRRVTLGRAAHWPLIEIAGFLEISCSTAKSHDADARKATGSSDAGMHLRRMFRVMEDYRKTRSTETFS